MPLGILACFLCFLLQLSPELSCALLSLLAGCTPSFLFTFTYMLPVLAATQTIQLHLTCKQGPLLPTSLQTRLQEKRYECNQEKQENDRNSQSARHGHDACYNAWTQFHTEPFTNQILFVNVTMHRARVANGILCRLTG